jgi:excisionase family DNA binding protein
MSKDFLTVDEVADRFGVNATTVYRLAAQGSLPGFKIGGQWRFDEAMLRQWVKDKVRMDHVRAEDQRVQGATPGNGADDAHSDSEGTGAHNG